jgi:hypothetical protein
MPICEAIHCDRWIFLNIADVLNDAILISGRGGTSRSIKRPKSHFNRISCFLFFDPSEAAPALV